MGKSTISMAIFNSKLLVYQRVSILLDEAWGREIPKGCTSSVSNSSGRPCLEIWRKGNGADLEMLGIPIKFPFWKHDGMVFIHFQDLSSTKMY